MRLGAQLLLTFLLNASWQIALVVVVAAAGDRLLRGTAARYRHALWVATLGLALVLPLLGPARLIGTLLVLKPQPVEIVATPVVGTRVSAPELGSLGPQVESPAASTPAELLGHPSRRSSLAFLASGIHLNRRVSLLLVVLYGLFLLYRAGQLVRAWRRTKTIVQSAYECEFPAQVKTIIEKCQTAFGVRRVRLLCSASVPVPITVGILRPLIILPDGLVRDADEEVLTSAIGHELVHVARRDYFANLIYEFVYLPLSFHPAAALLRRRIRQTRELCCDESVTAKLLRAETYARSLVRLIGDVPLGRRLAVDTTIGISEPDILEVRIMSLLKRPKLTARRKRLLLITASLLLVAPCIAATSFALTIDIDRQEPSVTPSAPEKIDRQKQEREREELKRAVRELKEKIQAAPESKRADAEARLLEVQKNLAEHERLLSEFNAQRDDSEKRTQELREKLAQLKQSQPVDEALVRELQKKIAEMDTLSGAERGLKERELIERVRTKEQAIKERLDSAQKETEAVSQDFDMKRRKENEEQRQAERARRQVDLTRDATLSMDRAIQIAISQVPGKVLACSLGRDGDKLFYHVVIINSEGDKSTATFVWVSATDGQILKTEKEERREEESALERSQGRSINGGVLNSHASSLPQPAYPAIAKAANAVGEVKVEVTVDETGRVIAAHAVSGHPLLQAAAVSAARQASFNPTRLSGEPVKVAGVLVYNFAAQ